MKTFQTVKEIEYWLEKMNSGHFDNIYENVCDMYKNEILIVHEFNKQIEFFLSEASP